MGLKIKSRRFGSKLVAFVATFALVMQPTYVLVASQIASADSGIIITNSNELRSAIENQADGQTWTIQPGEYAVTQTNAITAGGQTGWYFPVTANNVTIKGVGNPTIYGSGYTANGSWSTQELVAVFGNNVTIDGLTLMPKVEPNKTIDVIGSNFTLKNSTITPNTISVADYSYPGSSEDMQWGGSLLIENGSNNVIENVTIRNGGVSLTYAPAGTHVAFNNVKIINTTNVDWINGYRNSGFTNPNVAYTGMPSVEYRVGSFLDNLDSVLLKAKAGDTISLDSDLTVANQKTLTKAVTLNGNGHTISSNFEKTSNDNNSAIGVQASGVTINNLVVDGINGGQVYPRGLHGINIFQSNNVTLNNVTSKNNGYSGVNVNGSKVTVTNITTSGNGWHGIDVDKPGAVLTVNGTSHHTETVPQIYVDNTNVGQVIDTNHQYSSRSNVLQAGDRVYGLKPGVPTLLSPANNGYTTTDNFYFDWSDVPGAVEYEFQSSQNPTTVDGILTAGVWNNKIDGGPDRNHLTDSAIHSYGASGTWYWQARAIDANGIKSEWSPVWKMTIDTAAPANPTNLSWKTSANVTVANNGVTNKYDGTAQWQASTSSDVDHYVYKYWNDIAGNQYKVGNEYVTTTSSTSLPGVFNQGEGVHHFCVAAVDRAGNTSACTEFTITYDATAPTPPSLSSPSDNAIVKGASVTQSWTSVSDAHHYIYESYHDAGATNLRWHENVNGTSKTATNVANATYWWRVKAVDAAGNESDWSPLWKLTIDNTAPSVPVISNPADGSFFSAVPILNKWSASTDNTGVTGYQVAYRYDDGHTFGGSTCVGMTIGGQSVSGCRDTTATQRNHEPGAGEQGGVTVWVRAKDAAGNYSAWSTPVHYTYDATAPVVDIPTYTTLGGAITPQVNATDSNSPLSYNWAQQSGPTTGVTIATPLASNPGITVTETGSYVFKLTVKDPAGNQTVRTLSFDYTAPAPTVTTTLTPTPLASPVPVVTPIGQTPTTGDGFTNVAVAAADDDAGVLGATNNENTPTVKGASDQGKTLASTANPDVLGASDNKLFGLVWYWWLLIAAAVVAAGWWFIAAARRRRDGDDA